MRVVLFLFLIMATKIAIDPPHQFFDETIDGLRCEDGDENYCNQFKQFYNSERERDNWFDVWGYEHDDHDYSEDSN